MTVRFTMLYAMASGCLQGCNTAARQKNQLRLRRPGQGSLGGTVELVCKNEKLLSACSPLRSLLNTRILLIRALLLLAFSSMAMAAPTVTAPASAKVGGEIVVSVTGSSNPKDFVTIVPKASAEGSYGDYQYVSKPGEFKLRAPAEPGDYEVRVLGAQSPYPTLARRAVRFEGVAASLEAPERVEAGATFTVRWTGPAYDRDFVAIGDKQNPYIVYAYTRTGNPVALRAPDQAGDYELRYFLGSGEKVIAARRLVIGGVDAMVSGPEKVAAGARFAVTWSGPNNQRDYITVVKTGAPERSYEDYQYTTTGSPVQLRASDQPGEYELRYLTGQSNATLARSKITVTPITGSIAGPAEAMAGANFSATWKGPNYRGDYIVVTPKGARDGESGPYAYTTSGNPVALLAPLTPGDYELRYAIGQSHTTLASAPIRITPGKEAPGFVTVTANGALPAGSAVEIILDASGSMLQRLGSQRRIDIAKQTLTKLTSATLPAGTPFALRVFGREVDSCQTDLEIPLAPLDAGAVGARVAQLEAKNNAKTPIGASLEKVADDLKFASGERLVVLLTDGEETCGGDPAAAIEKLRKAHVKTRVSIVGFAIDDAKLAAAFRHWSNLGAGLYFDAKDAASLSAAMSQALRPAFEVLTAQGQIVAEGLAGGDPVRLTPGAYTVRLKGQNLRSPSVTVKAKETTTVQL
jgi:von Willebrand factor type A domain